jgi:hypothetical protein
LPCALQAICPALAVFTSTQGVETARRGAVPLTRRLTGHSVLGFPLAGHWALRGSQSALPFLKRVATARFVCRGPSCQPRYDSGKSTQSICIRVAQTAVFAVCGSSFCIPGRTSVLGFGVFPPEEPRTPKTGGRATSFHHCR